MIRTAPVSLALLVALCASAFAQRDNDSSLPGSSLEISGQVRTVSGQKTVENVLVRLERFGGSIVDQVTTDGTGRFRFTRLTPGQYLVSARADGLAARTPQIDVSRHLPRQHVILQLQPEEAAFGPRGAKPGAVDSRVPEEARREFEKGRAALAEKRADDAVRHLENAARLYPDFHEAHIVLADAHMGARRWEKAERALRRALEIRPKTSSTMINLGEAYRRQKKFAEAEEALVAALKLDRDSWQGHFALGRLYWERGEVVKAAPHVGQALKINPDYAEGHLLAGNIFVRLSLPENAIISYEEYLRLAPRGEFAKLTEENIRKLRKALPVRR